jgi:hypothetical protein
MRKAIVALVCVAIAGCAQQMEWHRSDGSPDRQADIAICRAAAMNAANQVPNPAPAPRTVVNNQVTVNTAPSLPQAPSRSGARDYLTVEGPTPPSYAPPQVDVSPLADAGATIAANARRSRTETANYAACMAQRGYEAFPAR